MRTGKLLRRIGMGALCLALTALHSMSAMAVQANSFSAGPPPQGWNHLCTGNSIHVAPAENSRSYSGSGTCWVLAPSGWVSANVTLSGAYRIGSNQFSESLRFDYTSIVSTRDGGEVSTTVHPRVLLSGVCGGDPWETKASCTTSGPNLDLNKTFGWAIRLPAGPLSRNVFGAGLIQALLSKQASRPPLSPVDLDAVRWPASDGKGSVGRVFWRVPDVSGNRWILDFDVEASMNSTDSAFFKVGQVTGPGATTNLSPGQISKFFFTPSKLQAAVYYFRVCSVNDVGRSCSASMKAREPTKTELMTAESFRSSHTTVRLGGQPGGTPNVPALRVGTRAPSIALGGGRGMQGIGPERTMSASGPRPPAAGAAPALMVARGTPLPDLAFSFVSVQMRTYTVTGTATSIVVEDPLAGASADACSKPYSFPIQLIVKNVGQATFVAKDSLTAVGVSIGGWNSAKDLKTLKKGDSQVMDFNVSVPPGKYALQANINLHNAVAESRSDNDSLSWPLELKCDVRVKAPPRLVAPAIGAGRGTSERMPAQRVPVPAVRPAVR